VLANALTVVDHTAERSWEAERHRLTGELRRRQAVPHPCQAETCFQQALGMARRQQAMSLERQAAISLNHLWPQQGTRAEASDLLASIDGRFIEGFDTADVRDAKAWLERLSGYV
jgi:predicted ATPase